MEERESVRQAGEGNGDVAVRLLRAAGKRRPVPADRSARVHDAVREHWLRRTEVRTRRRRLMWAVPLAAAATVVVAVGVATFLAPGTAAIGTLEVAHGQVAVTVDGTTTQGHPGARVVAGAEMTTLDGGRAAIRLAGGESLRLDENTELTLEGPDSLTLHRGAVYFDSGVGPVEARFSVVTAYGEISDIGTQFEARITDNSLRVSVREGVVRISREAGATEITRGGVAVIGADGMLVTSSITPSDPVWGWVLSVAPPFRGADRSVAELLAWSTRETGLELRWDPSIDSAKAGGIEVHGDLTQLRPGEVPAAVLPTCGLAGHIRDGVLLVDTLK